MGQPSCNKVSFRKNHRWNNEFSYRENGRYRDEPRVVIREMSGENARCGNNNYIGINEMHVHAYLQLLTYVTYNRGDIVRKSQSRTAVSLIAAQSNQISSRARTGDLAFPGGPCRGFFRRKDGRSAARRDDRRLSRRQIWNLHINRVFPSVASARGARRVGSFVRVIQK